PTRVMRTLPLRSVDLTASDLGPEPEARPPLHSPARRGPRSSRYAATLPTLGLVAVVLGSAAVVAKCVTVTLDAMALSSLLAFLRRSLPATAIEGRESEGGQPRD